MSRTIFKSTLIGGIFIATGVRLLYLKFQPIQVDYAVIGFGVLLWIVMMIRANTR